MAVNFDSLRKRRQPTRKEAANYRKWAKYLSNSKLSEDEVHRRAADLAGRGFKLPKGQ